MTGHRTVRCIEVLASPAGNGLFNIHAVTLDGDEIDTTGDMELLDKFKVVPLEILREKYPRAYKEVLRRHGR